MKIIQPQVTPLTPINGEQILLNLQRAAKTCYKSYNDKDTTESAKKIVKRLIDSGHDAMLEFETITMNYITNIATTKDLTRHRHASFAVESTRYCCYDKDKFGAEIKFIQPIEIMPDTIMYQIWINNCEQAEKNYFAMRSFGATPDQASLLLPQCVASEITMSANLREWRHILNLRALGTTGKPRPCVRQIMIPTLKLFASKIPVVFDDLLLQLNQKEK